MVDLDSRVKHFFSEFLVQFHKAINVYFSLFVQFYYAMQYQLTCRDELLKLAAAQRMNTDIRRKIFCVIMGSEVGVNVMMHGNNIHTLAH